MSDSIRGRLGAVLRLLIVLTVGASVVAAQESRVWTNKKGRKVTGVMKEKGKDWVKIQIKTKVHKIKLETLSEEDQEYVKNTKIRLPFSCKVTAESRKAGDLDFEVRTVTFELEGVEDLGQEVYLLLAWASSLRTTGKTSFKTSVEAYYDRDGRYSHEAMFSNNAKVGESFRGYAYRIVDEYGNKLVEGAEPSSAMRYLEHARSSFKPKTKKEAKKK